MGGGLTHERLPSPKMIIQINVIESCKGVLSPKYYLQTIHVHK